MIEVTVTVEDDLGDASLYGSSADEFADSSGLFDLVAREVDEVLGGAGDERLTFIVVDELDVDLLVAAENGHAGALGRSTDLAADAGFDLISSCYFRKSHV